MAQEIGWPMEYSRMFSDRYRPSMSSLLRPPFRSPYGGLLRTFILPGLDLCNRTDVTGRLRFLEESQWWSTEKLRALQDEKLRRLVQYAYEEVPYYRTVFRRHGRRPRDIQSVEDLPKLPIFDKRTVRKHLGDMVGRRFPKRQLLASETSGSTGTPARFFLSKGQEGWRWASRFRMWQWAGYQLGEPYVYLTGYRRTHWKKRLQDALFRGRYIHCLNMSDHVISDCLNTIERLKDGLVVSYASSIYVLARWIQEQGYDSVRPRAIVTHAETLLPHHRRVIEEAFRCPVFDLYGLGGEGMHVAAQCEQRGAYHVTMENVIVEFVADGVPVGPGVRGEIILTGLDNYGMPLIRYNTEDVGVASGQGCPCGRGLECIKSIGGRRSDVVIAPDGTVLNAIFFAMLFDEIGGIDQFQILQEVPERITVYLIRNSAFTQADARRIQQFIRTAAGESFGVHLKFVDEIPLSPSGKRRYIISEVASEETFRGRSWIDGWKGDTT